MGLHWLHWLHGEHDRYGEIDVAVLAPDGCLLLIEVKAKACQRASAQP
ncbi:hypothetical protein [Massilia sp. DWR3-1-1]